MFRVRSAHHQEVDANCTYAASLVSSLSASDCLVQPLRKDFLSDCTRQSLAESDDTRRCIRTIYVVDVLMMGGMRSKHVEEPNLM